MKFGPVPLSSAEGAVLAHSLQAGARRIRKGTILGAPELAQLRTAGFREVVVARADPGDVAEDRAAAEMAMALVANPQEMGLRLSEAFTGRVNAFSTTPGVFCVDAEIVNRVNAVDPSITLATLPDITRVAAGDMVATVKIIPYAVPQQSLDAAVAVAGGAAMCVHRRKLSTVTLILTRTQALQGKLLSKGQLAVEGRMNALGLRIEAVDVVDHETDAVREALLHAGGELVLVLGASATSDIWDVCPRALIEAGGEMIRFGMPVDPGNLLFLGRLGGRVVVGLPGCARSPAINGADWVLERVVCGLEVTSQDIARMGVGGLLMEIPTRPQPRAYDSKKVREKPRIEVILLAAGASRRMQGVDKLLQTVDRRPLIRRSAEVMLSSKVDAVHVVLPPDNATRRAALDGLEAGLVPAEAAAEGMAGSLRAGISALSPGCDAVIVALADMPEVNSEDVNSLIAAFDPAEGAEICRSVTQSGQPGHPVLFGRRFFESLSSLSGDQGARLIVSGAPEFVVDVPTAGDAAAVDLDTPQDWEAYRALEQSRATPSKGQQ